MTAPLLTAATHRLSAAGVANPRVDAELLLAHVLGVTRGRLQLADAPTPVDAAAYDAVLERRSRREPLQHITGTAPFRYLDIPVGPGVFVPRPETELLVDAVLPLLRAAPRPCVIDLCSGSGALALAIAGEVPTAQVVAVEREGTGLAWLRRNVAGTLVTAVAGDVADPELVDATPLRKLRGTTDAVVCNPPYVRRGADVAAEVAHDPAEAVFAGADGLALMPAVIALAAELLRTGGVLALEHDDTHAAAVPALLDADGRFTAVADHLDLAGRPRYATAVRR